MKLVWLRRDLRIEDNRALIAGLQSDEPVIALYVATPNTWKQHNLAAIQADLIYRRLFELQRDLNALNIALYYAEVETFADAAHFVAEMAQRAGVTEVYYNKEYEVDEQMRDSMLTQSLTSFDIDSCACDDKCMLEPGTVLNRQGEYFKVFSPFKRAYISQLERRPVTVSKAKRQVAFKRIEDEHIKLFSRECLFSYPRQPSDHFPVTTSAIIQRLRKFVADKVEEYHHQRDFPWIAGTSALSPYLAIGALSVRQCMARLIYQQSLLLTAGREVWQSELIWREFYQHLIYFEPKLSTGRCFSDWGNNLTWTNDPAKISAWQRGKTGYPIIDAAMRQLNQTGWMHNRLRMVVASFLVKDLHVDWRIGEQYFMSRLIDGDYAANNGGWQWCASVGCDSQPYFRIFNPITQGEKFDQSGEFVKAWIPELAEVETKHIHQPWKSPLVNSLSYPQPIVDHKTEREITLDYYKQAKEV